MKKASTLLYMYEHNTLFYTMLTQKSMDIIYYKIPTTKGRVCASWIPAITSYTVYYVTACLTFFSRFFSHYTSALTPPSPVSTSPIYSTLWHPSSYYIQDTVCLIGFRALQPRARIVWYKNVNFLNGREGSKSLHTTNKFAMFSRFP